MTNTETAETTNPTMRADGSALVEPAERERRLLVTAEALLDGRPHRWMVQQAIQTWGVSRRTAQGYVQEAEERLHADAEHLPPLFALELSQMQRNRFLRGLLERARRNDDLSVRDYCTLVSTANRLLDSRDRSSFRVLDQQARHKSARETALVDDVKTRMRELAERDKAAREQWEARTKAGAPAQLETRSPPSLLRANQEKPGPGQDEDEIDVSTLTEEEQEEWRELQEASEHQPTPAERAQWRAEGEAMMASLGLHPPGRETQGKVRDLRIATAAAPAAPVEPSSSNSWPVEDLRADRKRRREEKKRLRRLRKRTRGRG